MRQSALISSLALFSLVPLALASTTEGCGSTTTGTTSTGGTGGAGGAGGTSTATASSGGGHGGGGGATSTSATATSATTTSTGTGMGGGSSTGTGMGGGGGSGGDACQQASAKLMMCLNSTTSTGSSMVTCTGVAACTAGCINNTDCVAINDAFSGMPSNLSKPFLDCLTTCSNGSGVGGGGGAGGGP